MSLDLLPRPLPLITADLPGTGGTIKVTPEDFVVEELPAYLPSGEGPHLYVWVEKRDLTTNDAAKLLARAAGVSERDLGYAGQKDRFALTRQWFSVATDRPSLTSDNPRLRILEQQRHVNKLKPGHLRGNRFTVVIRGVVPEGLERARAILDRLARTGLPNFFGPQRFGKKGDNALLGAALLGLCGHPELQRAASDRHLRRLMLSALQSELFNRCLTDRITAGLWSTVLEGDVLQRRGGGTFNTTEPEVDQQRLLLGEVDITGPLPGTRERPEAKGAARAREDAVLAACGVPREALDRGRGETEGARRAYRVPLTDVTLRELPGRGAPALELSFPLPSGAYATRVLAELTKTELVLPEG